MAMSEEEKSAYLDSIDAEVNAAVDAAFLKLCGRTFREDEVVPRHAEIPHAHKNGDSSHVPTDSWQQIKQDFPALFGKPDDAP
jgi:hypothetical protein